MTRYDVVVLGAGPAGAAAAWYAARSGRSTLLLDRADRVGGLAGSFEVAGVRVDHGSHRLHPATPPDILADIRSLLGTDLQTRSRNGRLLVYDSWVPFPLNVAALARAMPPAAVLRVARDTLLRPLRGRGDDTYAGRLVASLGPELYAQLFGSYAEKLWGLPGDAISAEQARVRVTADNPWKIATRVLRAQPGGQGRVFHYPRRGFGHLTEAIADAAAAEGADIRLGTEVSEIADGSVVAAGARYDGVVLSTLPVTTLARLSGAPDLARGLDYRAMVLVYLAHGGGRWTSYDAHYLPSPGTPITRVSEPANYRDSSDDPTDRSVVCAEIPCDMGDSVWRASDDELAALVQDGLARTGLAPVNSQAVAVRRLPVVYPVYRLGFEQHLARLEEWAGGFSRVITLGRNGLFAHDNTHHALAMARDAVAALDPSGGVDHESWTAARARFRDHVVED